MLDGACRIAVEKGGFLLAWIGLAEPSSSQLEIKAHASASPETLRIVKSFVEGDSESQRCFHTEEALRTGQPSVCNDIQHDPRSLSWRDVALERGYRAMASLPITRAGQTIGTFNLYASEAAFFEAAEVALLTQLAADISLGLESQRREERRVEAEQALRASEERFRELAETIQEVFWITDARKTQLLYVSPAYETVWGRTLRQRLRVAGELARRHPSRRSRAHRRRRR